MFYLTTHSIPSKYLYLTFRTNSRTKKTWKFILEITFIIIIIIIIIIIDPYSLSR